VKFHHGLRLYRGHMVPEILHRAQLNRIHDPAFLRRRVLGFILLRLLIIPLDDLRPIRAAFYQHPAPPGAILALLGARRPG